MKIRFRCHHCGAGLSAPEEQISKSAKCPKCGTMLTIPSESPEVAQKPEKPDSSTAGGKFPIQPTAINLDQVVRDSTRIFKSRWGFVIAVYFLAALGDFSAWLLGVLLVWGISYLGVPLLSLATGWLVQIAVGVLGVYLWIGASIILLNIARGRQVALRQMFDGGPYLLRVFVVWLLFSAIVSLGTMACIIPGIILALMFGQFHWLIIDKDQDFFQSLKVSMQITSGNKWSLFMLLLAGCCIGLGGPVAIRWAAGMWPSGLWIVALAAYVLFAIVIVAPYFSLLWAVAYMKMAGQPLDKN